MCDIADARVVANRDAPEQAEYMAGSSFNPHDILGVPVGASIDVLRAAYKRAALESHPDKGGSKEAFQRVALAFEELSAAGGDWKGQPWACERSKPKGSKTCQPQEDVAKRQAAAQERKQRQPQRRRAASNQCPSGHDTNFPEELRRLLQCLGVEQRRQVIQS
eukprot:410970-Amphidinium_carterae.1